MFSSRAFALLTAALLVSSSPLQEKRAPLATVYMSCTVPNSVALTFDDGPYIYNQDVVDELVAAGVKGTFFFNGNNYGCIYDPDMVARVQYTYSKGMMVADHTWSHADLTTLSVPQINDAMYRMEEAFSRILGIKPAFMRPPYGNYNNDVLTVAAARNQSVVIWDQDTGDADGATVAASKQVYTDAVNAHPSTMLVLNHETIQTTSTQVLPFAIPLLQQHGYNLVTLAECLGLQPYAAIGIPQTGSWSCDGTPDPGEACSGSSCETGTPILLTATGTPTTTTTTTTSTTSTTTTPAPTVTGQVIHPSASNTMCLAAASNTNGAAVSIQNCDGSASQSWTRSGNTWQVFGKCLNVNGGSTTNGVKMQIATCAAGSANQQFTSSGNTIVWTGHNECLDLTDGSLTSGNVVQMWQCFAGNTNQMWNVGTGTTPPPTTTTTTTTTTPTPTPSGKTIRPGSGSTICLTAASNANGAAVQIQPCTANSASQSWSSVGSTLTIFGNKCLDVTNGSTANGNKMQIYTCNTGNPNQSFTKSGSTIVWTGHNECLDLTDGLKTSGNVVQMWQCAAGNQNQVWNFV